jgi:hypothetical protein
MGRLLSSLQAVNTFAISQIRVPIFELRNAHILWQQSQGIDEFHSNDFVV